MNEPEAAVSFLSVQITIQAAYIYCNSEVCSCNHCYSGKAI